METSWLPTYPREIPSGMKLVIHLGYPKTATTTIQNVYFKKLHEQNKINYLGRLQRHDNVIMGVDRLREYLFFDTPLDFKELSLSNEVVNLISDEEFTSPSVYMQHKYGTSINTYDFPQKIQKLIDGIPGLEVDFVFIIRNQVELVYSWYAQMYRFFAGTSEDTVSRHAFMEDRLFGDYFDTYFFSDFIGKYKDFFCESRIHISFFEDFRKRDERFLSKWDSILNVDASDIYDEVFYIKMNSKIKQGEDAVVHSSILRNLPLKISRVLPESFKNRLREKGITNKILTILQEMTFFQRKNRIVNFTREEKEKITNVFIESNAKLINMEGVTEEKLKLYKYL